MLLRALAARPGGKNLFRNIMKFVAPTLVSTLIISAAVSARAAQLSSDARAAIPHEVQQLVVIDYRAMQNSPTAMDLRDRVMPPPRDLILLRRVHLQLQQSVREKA